MPPYPFKELLDEYKPLVEFADLYCKNDFVQVRYTGRETQVEVQKYDGEIKMPDGTVLTIEIAKPFDGRKSHTIAEQLNKNGYSDVEIGDCNDHAKAITAKIVETANNKARKNYKESILVVCSPDINWYANLDEKRHRDICYNVITALRQIKYNAKEVFLLSFGYSSDLGDVRGELIKIA